MKVLFSFCILVCLVTSQSLQPVTTASPPPKYDIDLCGSWEGTCNSVNVERTDLKIIGKRGIMGTSFERILTKFSGNSCDEEAHTYATKYNYTVVNEVADAPNTYNCQPTAIYVAMWGNKYQGSTITCDAIPQDGTFVDVTTIPDECGSVFRSLKAEVSDPEGSVLEFEFLVEGTEFSFDYISMTRVHDDGCFETTTDTDNDNNTNINITVIIIIIIVIVVIFIIFLFLLFTKINKNKKHDLKRVEKQISLSQNLPSPIQNNSIPITSNSQQSISKVSI